MQRRVLTAACVAVWMAAAWAQPRALPQNTDDGGLIVGQVVDARTGRGVPGVLVSLTGGAARSPGQLLTGSDGRFYFSGLGGGRYGITAVKTGYAPGALGRRRPGGLAQPLLLGPGERVSDATVLMWRLGAIEGRVVDEAGEPMVGVEVFALRRGVTRGRMAFSGTASAQTDDRGVYRIGGLLPGRYVAGVLPTHASLPDSLLRDVQDGVRTLEPRSAATATLVISRSPRARQAGDVHLRAAAGSPLPMQTSGGFFLYPSTFHPASTSPAGAMIVRVASGEEVGAVDLQLAPVPAFTVSGTLTGPEGAVEGLALRLRPADGQDELPDREPLLAFADREGAFTFLAVPPGRYVVTAAVHTTGTFAGGEPPLSRWAAEPVAVARGDVGNLVVTLRETLRVSGRFEFDGGQPPPRTLDRVPIIAEPLDPHDTLPPPTGEVDRSGHFVIGGLLAGRYLIKVTASPPGWMFLAASHEGRDVSTEPLMLTGNAREVVIRFTGRWSGVSGTVRSEAGGPDPDALVVLFPTDPAAWTDYGAAPRRLKSARTSNAGAFALSSVPPGDYYMLALPDAEAEGWQEPEMLQALAAAAAVVQVREGEHVTRQLRTRRVPQ